MALDSLSLAARRLVVPYKCKPTTSEGMCTDLQLEWDKP